MKLKTITLAATISSAALLALQACTGNSNEQKDNNTSVDSIEELTEVEQTTFYLLPSPEDIFAFSAETMKYSPSLLNSTEKASSYVDTKMTEINYGVYIADMAYAAAFGEYKDATKYLNTIKEVSSKLGLESIFNQALAARVDKFIANRDSLKDIANDTYFDIKRSLETNNRNSTIAQISAGGWVECMYIITNSIEKFSDSDPNIQHIADERNVFNSLVEYLKQLKEKPGISETIEDIKPIEEAYSKLTTVEVEQKKNVSEDGPIQVGGNKKIVITEETFNNLKESIGNVRQVLTTNK